jgi:hypothetical protein
VLVDLDRSLPLLDPDRTVRQGVKLASQARELGGVAGAVQELEPHHVACGYLLLDEVLVEGGAQLAADGAGPDPGAGVSQLHLRELSWTADLLQRVGGEVGEVALGEAFARGTVDDRTQRSMDRVGSRHRICRHRGLRSLAISNRSDWRHATWV